MDPVVKYDETCDISTNKIVATSVVCARESSSNDTSQIESNSSPAILDDTFQENVQNHLSGIRKKLGI